MRWGLGGGNGVRRGGDAWRVPDGSPRTHFARTNRQLGLDPVLLLRTCTRGETSLASRKNQQT